MKSLPQSYSYRSRRSVSFCVIRWLLEENRGIPFVHEPDDCADCSASALVAAPKYSWNHALKHPSYLCFRGVHCGEIESMSPSDTGAPVSVDSVVVLDDIRTARVSRQARTACYVRNGRWILVMFRNQLSPDLLRLTQKTNLEHAHEF